MRGWIRLGVLALLPLAACSHRLTSNQIAVLQQQGFQARQENWELALSDKLLFDSGSDELKLQTRASIERTGVALASVGIRNVRVEGHTDAVGSDAFNQALSERRAEAVAQALLRTQAMQKAGATTSITAEGFGKRRPVATNATAAGRAENRRVAVIVPGEQE